MESLNFVRCVLGICAVAAVLAGCGGSQPPISAPGAMRQATVPRILPGGSFKVLYRFDGPDGQAPQAGLIDVDGTLYGTTNYGGKYGSGTVFSITTAGSEKVLHSFKGGADGSSPQSGLLDVNGTLYGTTSLGGGLGGSGCLGYGCGTVYRVSLTGAEKVLHSFAGGSDGAAPMAGLIDVNDTLFGTTAGGGSSKSGTVYSISTTGSEKVLYSFTGGSDGALPQGGLINVHGTLYGGTTFGGGSSGYGTVYRISTSGSEKVLHSFGGGDGANPMGNLFDVNGTLYGTTSAAGGVHSRGTVYSISTTGVEKVLYDFRTAHGGHDGETPYAGLIDVKGTLYGTTDQGGGAPLYGVVYSVSTAGAETVLHRFGNGPDGAHPWAGLVNVKGTLYGTTLEGGSGCSGGGCGTVFALTP
ncbi:MAG: choice-of-anchor tandem repeat GloVer-containing protein [Candidatus Cybelea sp.]|jgi:uncharacterized repeat protein (TIGR03803 family)